MLRFKSLASGSAGNALLVQAGSAARPTQVLVDCGMGLRQLQHALLAAGSGPECISGLFITHEHGDHVGSALLFAARYGTPIWCSAGTAAAMHATTHWEQLQMAGRDVTIHLVADGQGFAVGDMQLHPFTVPHDAQEPLQVRCTDGDRSLGVLTDAGHITPHALAMLDGVHALVLESNHDPDLLAQSRYPPFLKRRVAGEHGHLSNAQAADALKVLQHPALKEVVAAHLSERNNQPELVQRTLAAILGANAQDMHLALRGGSAWFSA